jgi:tetraacyldisaccharide 4'-kinase
VARSSLEHWFARTWLRRGPAARLLWPLSLLFGLLAGARRMAYRAGLAKSERLAVPVIVVGNIFIGGTGKTPFTIWLLDALQRAGFHPGVISRGHGAKNDQPQVVDAASLPAEVGDEPLLIAQRSACPVVVGRNRVAAGRCLLAQFPAVDVIVSDDGLQHYALQRDIEIIVSDGRGEGNGWLLPAGPLREPASRRRDFTVVNSSEPPDTPAWQMQMQGSEIFNLKDSTGRIHLRDLAGRASIAAAAGIGNPERFFSMLQSAGLRFHALPLPDHFDYAGYSFAHVPAQVILITEKDAVKCRHIPALAQDGRLWVVPVAAQLDAALAEQIVEKLHGYATA